MLKIAMVLLGGAIGALGRYLIAQGWRIFSPALGLEQLLFPVPTLIANLIASFILGIISARFVDQPLANTFLAAGLCGALSTYSTFTLEILTLLQIGNYKIAITYFIITTLTAILFAFLGIALASN